MEEKYYYLLSFLVPFLIRTIPEVISFPWPIGYDTITFYVPVIHDYQIWGSIFSLTALTDWHSAPLLYIVMGFLGYISRVDPILIIKFFGPFLSGCLGLSVFFFSKSYLGWSNKKSLVCALICTSYFVTLRLTWDSYRNVLGLIFFILTMSQLSKLEKRRNVLFFLIFSFLCAFSHELVTVILLITLIYLVLLEFYKKLKENGFQKKRLTAFISSIFLSSIFFISYYTNWLGANIYYFDNPFAEYFYGGILVDYISLRVGFYLYPTVDVLNAHIIQLFVIGFAPILFFAVLGYFRNDVLDVTTLFLLIGSFMPLALPHSALPLWSRWMLMLTIPLTVYATNFLFPDETNTLFVSKLRISKFIRTRFLVIFISLLIVLSFTYMVMPPDAPFPYFNNINTARYLTPSMQRNTVPVSMCQEVVFALNLLGFNMSLDSCIIAHESLAGWAQLAFPFKPVFVYYSMDAYLQSALFLARNFDKIYVITMIPYDHYFKQNGFDLSFQLGLIRVYVK